MWASNKSKITFVLVLESYKHKSLKRFYFILSKKTTNITTAGYFLPCYALKCQMFSFFWALFAVSEIIYEKLSKSSSFAATWAELEPLQWTFIPNR